MPPDEGFSPVVSPKSPIAVKQLRPGENFCGGAPWRFPYPWPQVFPPADPIERGRVYVPCRNRAGPPQFPGQILRCLGGWRLSVGGVEEVVSIYRFCRHVAING